MWVQTQLDAGMTMDEIRAYLRTFDEEDRYDIDEEQRLTDSIGLTYLDECFMLSATYAETFIEDPTRDIEPDRVVMLRFELKHLGGFNYQTNVVDFAGGEDATAVSTVTTPQP